MNDKQALRLACALTGDSVEAVLSHRLTDTQIIFVVDRGIAGCPKYAIDLDQLEQPQEPAAPAPKEETKPEAEVKPKARTTRRRSTKK